MLKKTMESLLQAADDTETADLTARIHSLNVLRSIFKDTELSLDIMQFVAAGAGLHA
eukprot:COSAG05_NODE_6174_length_1008_cov_1.137514_1_plen_57_part_00